MASIAFALPSAKLALPSANKTSLPETTRSGLPVREIPGSYGLPLIGAFKDRMDYFYNQGRDEFFRSRIHKYKSTVFRTNMPPGPFISTDPRVVVLLDGKSFPILFDLAKVEKRDVFTGTFTPSASLTGGYRVLPYLDTTEPNHSKLKQLVFFLLKSRRDHVIPEFHSEFLHLFQNLEAEMEAKGKADFGEANDAACFSFLCKALYGTNPVQTGLGSDGPKLLKKWVLLQLSPILTLGLPKLLEDLAVHTLPPPAFLARSDYRRLYDFFYKSSRRVLDEAEEMGLSRDEACHNLLFATCFSACGGMMLFFPTLLKCLSRGGAKLHSQLSTEIRSAISSAGGEITIPAMEAMPLMKSAVYEAFRFEPPVPLQYARAREDLVVESHHAAFRVKKGELMFGYQPFATRDPYIFRRGEEFVADRFVGEGEALLKHVLWSNGPETENPTRGNKQCAGKELGMLTARLLVVELFTRYDSFQVEVGSSPLGSSLTFTSLKRATS